MEKNIAVIRGDGIGPEIVNATLQVLAAVGEKFGHKFNYTDVDMGGCSIDKHGVPLTEEAIAACRASDSVLLGAIGGRYSAGAWFAWPARGDGSVFQCASGAAVSAAGFCFAAEAGDCAARH